MFTKDQVVNLLEKSWEMKDIEKQLKADRKKLLNNIIVTIEEKVPFNMLFVHLESLGILSSGQSLKDIKNLCNSGNGGNCMVINWFTCSLLKALGYSAHVFFATVTSTQTNPHPIIIVNDLEKACDLHLVDCGLGLPSFQAISLNFDHESPVYKESFLEYRFIRHGRQILRMHGQGDMVDHSKKQPHLDFFVGKWRRFYSITVSAMTEVNSIEDLHAASYTNIPNTNITGRSPPRMAARFPAGKAVIISGNRLLLENNEKRLEEVTMDTRDEILKAYQKYFPMIDKHVVCQAYADWSQPSPKA